MGLATLLEHTLSGITGLVRPPTATALFRRADQYRNEGRYSEAAELVAHGLGQAPDSSVGHLLSAYLHVARREMEPAKQAFQRVLALDPYHPRALLGLARIAIEEDDVEGSKPLLDRALQFYPDFPEAHALRDMVGSWSSARAAVAAADAPPTPPRGLEAAEGGVRDVIVTRTDGTLVLAGDDDGRARPLAQHLTQVHRMASAVLARAGLGPFRHGVIKTGVGTTFLLGGDGLLLSATVDEPVDISAALVRVERLWATLGIKP